MIRANLLGNLGVLRAGLDSGKGKIPRSLQSSHIGQGQEGSQEELVQHVLLLVSKAKEISNFIGLLHVTITLINFLLW